MIQNDGDTRKVHLGSKNTIFFLVANILKQKRILYICHMIQRIQSIYLLLAALLPLYVGIFPLFPKEYLLFGNISYHIPIILFGILTGVLILINIFNFKDRKKQFVVNRVAILLNFILLGLMIFGLLNLSGEEKSSVKGIEPYFILISIVLLVLANKAIKKDEELVKSVDRLR